MFLTRECDYGLRIIRALAGGEKATAEEICKAETIPSQFAYKILKKLERAGWIMSSRGRDGGYWLVKPLDAITIYDVVSTIDEYLFINECLRDDKDCIRDSEDQPCAVHRELSRIQERLVKDLRHYSIDEIVKRNSEANESG
ncbi:MAG: Rrf2 family transcriptional regulator [Oscillospiraceae bacterium]|nr:Rrf2 family transcriptional regulator [Oscillospiraceae bacterium]